MLNYIHLGGQDRPITFAYSTAYEYELQTGKSYEKDVAELAGQIIVAGASIGTDDVATAVAQISMVKYIDIAFAALRAGHLKAKIPVTFTVHDVADWFGDDKQKAGQFTEMLLSANFNLKPDQSPGDSESPGDSVGDSKKKAPETELIGTNS